MDSHDGQLFFSITRFSVEAQVVMAEDEGAVAVPAVSKLATVHCAVWGGRFGRDVGSWGVCLAGVSGVWECWCM